MASTTKEKKASRDYYRKNKKYREQKIEDVMKSQRANKEKYNASKRKYYADNETYRKYKRNYAKEYRKREPIKSRARKDRKAYKER